MCDRRLTFSRVDNLSNIGFFAMLGMKLLETNRNQILRFTLNRFSVRERKLNDLTQII